MARPLCLHPALHHHHHHWLPAIASSLLAIATGLGGSVGLDVIGVRQLQDPPEVTTATATATEADPNCDASWARPVNAAVVDGFRSPQNPFGPGNRGLEYNTANGDPVTAVAAGEVVFAGQVGGTRFVVAQHGPVHKVTYGYLATVDVAVGDLVEAGDRIGGADVGFHLTVRVPATASGLEFGVEAETDVYVDPAPLLVGDCFVVKLVPLPEGLG